MKGSSLRPQIAGNAHHIIANRKQTSGPRQTVRPIHANNHSTCARARGAPGRNALAMAPANTAINHGCAKYAHQFSRRTNEKVSWFNRKAPLARSSDNPHDTDVNGDLSDCRSHRIIHTAMQHDLPRQPLGEFLRGWPLRVAVLVLVLA